ncbi:MAG: histidine triad nucleotide-binding protein, partial [Burkholderiaceae bacterium]
MHDENCLFCNIAAGKIPSKKVYEDQDIFVFHDIAPWAPIHFLIVPKAHISSMAQLTSSDAALMGKIMTLAPKLALEQGCEPYPEGGFRMVVNTGDHGMQEVQHLHV